MKTVVHTADSRGYANHGWLKSRHTFSFAGYYDPERVHFGALRVLNDDEVAAGQGFGTHPHDNMEIVSIPLFGDLEHKDSTGRHKVIKQGDVQIMSAGTGIQHSEYNHNADQDVHFLQIWVFPKEHGIEPRYEQKSYSAEDRMNKWQTVVSPEGGEAVWINQDAYFSLANLDAGETLTYKTNKAGNGVYLFVLNGEVTAAGEKLDTRDAVGVSETDSFEVKAGSYAEVLAIEVPMAFD
ncbi:pirin family protein [Roseivirga pacifica]|uniref:pirin family protein n=1 Tax=Roseivirga pacifica TaxID=1267423 RepID=UPI0020964123|nr:pirin family protein [Roseivirga pacifica]MCO6358801.1 pirin family protein [Roseivirga pacifica]MCO6365563.1 pirin family protein [Roseivirga pacifica]MCO6371707.1 pirin family protein [Roseivirga pacifica]MCO6376182.1 pirin family protein [Roseivirga pacifica]MCO6379085.1 pirin family protein [Roseivirga pacifica]